MSQNTAILEALHEIPTADAIRAEHHISLLDQTRPIKPRNAERDDSDSDTAPPTPSTEYSLVKKFTNQSLSIHNTYRQQRARQKYGRYDKSRYDWSESTAGDSTSAAQEGEVGTREQASYLDRSRAIAKGLLKRRRTHAHGKDDRDTVIDVLYENQRGSFFFGIPRYSANSLLPSDPKSWQNAQFRTSPVDIRNAQLPDPSWEWAWKSWYVDMSRDVDEEGWEYSFMFKAGFSWHGNHPWFHSFVRRRRWLRMRRRRDMSRSSKEKAHDLTAEYFTIHSKTLQPGSDDQSQSKSKRITRPQAEMEVEPDIDKAEITDIASLMRILRKAAVDRQKLVAVRKFVAQGGDELFYLSDAMPNLMSIFVYQSSRRQLLADLVAHYDEARGRKDSLEAHSHDHDDEKQQEHDTAVQHTEYLLNAIKAAEEQVKRLEYWSDVKGVSHNDDSAHPEGAFRSKEHHTKPASALKSHPTDPSAIETSSITPTNAASKKSSVYFDAKPNVRARENSDDGASLEAYVTAAESASELRSPDSKGKGKGRVTGQHRNLDGVAEEQTNGTSPEKEAEAAPMQGMRFLEAEPEEF